MLRLILLIVNILFINLLAAGAGNDLTYIRFFVENGLSHNTIKCIYQDSKGFVWIGTPNGLNKYDGHVMRNFYKSDLKNSNSINSICEDDNGCIWIGTDSGISIYDNYDDQFYKASFYYDNLKLNNKVSKIYKMNGRIWTAVEKKGLYCFNVKEKSFRNICLFDSINNQNIDIDDFIIDENNTLWLSPFSDNLYYMSKDMKQIVPYSTSCGEFPFKNVKVTRIINGPYNKLYISTISQGLLELNLVTGSIRKILHNDINHFIINDMFFDQQNMKLWIATTNGLYVYDTKTEEILFYDSNNDRFSLSDNEIISILINKKSGVWVGTYNGLNYNNVRFSFFNKIYRIENYSLKNKLIRGFCQGGDNILWIASKNAGLFTLNMEDRKIAKYNNDNVPDNIFSICYDYPYLWISSHINVSKLNILDNKIECYLNDNSDASIRDKYYKIYKNSLNEIYVSSKLGLYKFNKEKNRFVSVNALKGIFIYDIIEDSKGNMWFASYSHGLYKYDKRKSKIYNYTNKSQKNVNVNLNKVLSIFEDSKKNIWIATDSSISLFDENNKVIKSYVYTDNPFSIIAYKMIEDDYGCFWITTDKGLLRFDPKMKEFKMYTEADGLLNNEFDYCSGFKSKDGSIYWGSKDGFIFYNPKDFINDLDNQSSIIITDLYINKQLVKPNEKNNILNRNINITKKITLKENNNNVGIYSSIINYVSPSKTYIYYRLKGYSDTWIKKTSQELMEFSNLDVGKYILEIKGVNSDSGYVVRHASIEIVIKPFFYKSKLAILIYIITTLGILFWIMKYQKRVTVRKHEQFLKDYEKEKELKYNNEKIEFFSNIAHEIKTPLTLIKVPLENIISNGEFNSDVKEELEIINNNANHLSQLINELLDFSKIEKQQFKLNCSKLDVVEKINYIYYNYKSVIEKKNMQFIFQHDGSYYINADEQCLFKIINNLMSNAVKYADSFIRIELFSDSKYVKIKMTNDGDVIPIDKRSDIFERFVQYKKSPDKNTEGFGIGLSLARKIAELHDGKLYMGDSTDYNVFILELPKYEDAALEVEEEQIINYDNKSSAKKESETRPAILIVEDNEELLKYVYDKFLKDYEVYKAFNGEEAFGVLEKTKIDIIITDVYMPKMNGFELCKKLKEQFETSHIPIIMVSAYSSINNKIKGAESGADIYIEKPFSIKYLISCIENLLQNRRRLVEIYTSRNQEPNNGTHMDILSKRDQKFLEDIDNDIINNMSNPDYCIEQLAENLCLSKSSLSRKVKGLLNTTPNEYIKIKRLLKAEELIKEGSEKINAICYIVGFNSNTYFAKCFKDFFGKTPTEVKNNK